jgi:hypothetical protein
MADNEDEVAHSKLGVASFLIGIGIFISSVVLILTAVWGASGSGISEFQEGFAIFVVYYVLLFAPMAHFTGLISGICGCLQNKRRKILAIVGIVINLLFLCIHFGIRSYFIGSFWR